MFEKFKSPIKELLVKDVYYGLLGQIGLGTLLCLVLVYLIISFYVTHYFTSLNFAVRK